MGSDWNQRPAEEPWRRALRLHKALVWAGLAGFLIALVAFFVFWRGYRWWVALAIVMFALLVNGLVTLFLGDDD